jgi:hypothetical protein
MVINDEMEENYYLVGDDTVIYLFLCLKTNEEASLMVSVTIYDSKIFTTVQDCYTLRSKAIVRYADHIRRIPRRQRPTATLH